MLNHTYSTHSVKSVNHRFLKYFVPMKTIIPIVHELIFVFHAAYVKISINSWFIERHRFTSYLYHIFFSLQSIRIKFPYDSYCSVLLLLCEILPSSTLDHNCHPTVMFFMWLETPFKNQVHVNQQWIIIIRRNSADKSLYHKILRIVNEKHQPVVAWMPWLIKKIQFIHYKA